MCPTCLPTPPRFARLHHGAFVSSTYYKVPAMIDDRERVPCYPLQGKLLGWIENIRGYLRRGQRNEEWSSWHRLGMFQADLLYQPGKAGILQ